MNNLFNNYYETASIILFGVGLTTLLMHHNLIKKVIGMNIMEASIFLYFVSKGYVSGGKAPIIESGIMNASNYVNPVPTGLMLTGIVISVCETAFALALIKKFYERYGTLNLDGVLIEEKGVEE